MSFEGLPHADSIGFIDHYPQGAPGREPQNLSEVVNSKSRLRTRIDEISHD